jgi:hypothetical protein
LTLLATIILLMKMKLIGHVAGVVAGAASSGADLEQTRTGLMVHAGAGLLVLLMATTLSVYKPWGPTRYGRLKQQERRESSAGRPISAALTLAGPDKETTGDGRPLGLKIFLAVVGMLVAVFVVLHLTGGGHGSHGH